MKRKHKLKRNDELIEFSFWIWDVWVTEVQMFHKYLHMNLLCRKLSLSYKSEAYYLLVKGELLRRDKYGH